MKLVLAISHAQAIGAFADLGHDALRSEIGP